MRPKKLLTLLTVLAVLFIFVGWIFSLKYSFSLQEREDQLKTIFEKTFSQFNQTWQETKERFILPAEETVVPQKEDSSELPLSEEQLEYLKEKVLEQSKINE